MKAAEDYQIQGHTEQVIDAFVERCENDDGLLNSAFIVEPSQNFKESFPLVMAPCLVDINYAPSVKVRVMNPFPADAKINQKPLSAQQKSSQAPPENFLACENKHEEGNSSSTRDFNLHILMMTCKVV